MLDKKKSLQIKQSNLVKKRFESIIKFSRKNFVELLKKREHLLPEIKDALLCKTKSFPFNCWWRLTSSKYSENPLSAKGSYKSPHGGRFNIGQVDTIQGNKISPFPALYLGETKRIVLCEKYPKMKDDGSSSEDRMLNSQKQDLFVKVNGSICNLLDIDKPDNLSPFVQVIKKIDYDEGTKNEVKKRELSTRKIQTEEELIKALYLSDWKNCISTLEDPAPSQIFGHILNRCGIGGALYTSSQGNGKCLALFLENFKNSDSFIELIDTDIEKSRIDKDTFNEFM